MKTFIQTVGCLVAVVLVGPAAAIYERVFDTGYGLTNPVTTPSLYWVDSERLLFAGFKTADMRAAIAAKEVNRGERLKKLYLWDGANKFVRFYADAQGACLSNGVIRYQVRVDKAAGKLVVKEGQFGSEKEVEERLPSQAELSTEARTGMSVRSNFTCKRHLRNELVPAPSRYRYVVVLRDGDGYVDVGSADFKERQVFPRNLVLYQAKTGKAVLLSMTWDEDFSPSEVAYSPYRGAYVLHPRVPAGGTPGHIQPWPRDRPFVVYLLSPDGRTEAISIPYVAPGNISLPRPTRRGWIFGGGDFYKSLGLYFFDGKALSRIDAGAVSEIAVSPDGCKAAVGIQNKHLEMSAPVNLRVFNFCAGGR